ncbi:unnamed protein product [Peronospora belbahrii]|uniref:Uncharacterized protein n=1 Tax=Peronospora belbahrii TaxID=622444 RepID=A0ABN8CXK6_9STRA|nr:unnamed protein product [Peronospora belbahrii]
MPAAWWSGFSKLVMRPQATHCAGLPTAGGGTLMPRIDLLSPYVPVGWRVSLFGGLGSDGMSALREVDLEVPRVGFHSVGG